MSIDGYIPVSSTPGGPKVDVSELIRDDATVIERQRVAISDASDPDIHAKIVGPEGRGAIYVLDKEAISVLNDIRLGIDQVVKLLQEILK